MPVPEYLDWPFAESAILSGVIDALRSRSKALNNHVHTINIEVCREVHDGSDFERLNLELQNAATHADRFSLAFWDDGLLWLDARRGSKRGWDYQFSFYGDFWGIDPLEIRETIERSLWITDESDMRSIWSRFKPQTL